MELLIIYLPKHMLIGRFQWFFTLMKIELSLRLVHAWILFERADKLMWPFLLPQVLQILLQVS